jgi:membrane fusion protein, multidrug efflux system
MTASKTISDHRRSIAAAVVVIAVLAIAAHPLYRRLTATPQPQSAAPTVTVSRPVVRKVTNRTDFLGQFSAVEAVELRAQVGGVLKEIRFTDGQVVHKGDLLFVIDTRPYEIKLEQARAGLETARSRLTLATSQLERTQRLREIGADSAQSLDERTAELIAAQGAVVAGTQAVKDAQLDLEYCRIVAPFSGRMSRHRISTGNLVSGSRTGATASTLLSTIVSLNPIYLDFDMSESDFLAYRRSHADGAASGKIVFSLADDDQSTRTGTLDFIDNALDRGSGTIHARATVQNPDLFLVPGVFAHLTLTVGSQHDALLVPEASLFTDQSQRAVLTVSPDGTVVPKTVVVGARYDDLRVITSGLTGKDRVIVDGLTRASPGGKVSPEERSIGSAASGID